MMRHETMVTVGCWGHQGHRCIRVFQHAIREVIRHLRQSMRIVGVQEGVLAALLGYKADVRMRSRSRLIGERLGHKSGVVAQLTSNIFYAIFEREAQVTGSYPLVWPLIGLELTGAIFGLSCGGVES